jgi:hypothetical protein
VAASPTVSGAVPSNPASPTPTPPCPGGRLATPQRPFAACLKAPSPGLVLGARRAVSPLAHGPARDEARLTSSPARGHGHGHREDPRESPGDAIADALDPAARRAAQLAPPPVFTDSLGVPPQMHIAAADLEASVPRARVSMEELLPQLVRRIAWAGDRRKGTVQLELGAGAHSGTVITVHADGGRVRVEIDGAGDLSALRSRIDARLAKSGLAVEGVA